MSDTVRIEHDDTAPQSAGEPADDVTARVADEVDEAVDENPEIEFLTRLGWIAKGVVYSLMGLTAISIARQQASSDEASPSGALDKVLEQPGGRILLGVVAIGLLLYATWRILSVAVIRGHELRCWLDRIGYTFSAVFYLVLCYTATRAVINNHGPEGGNSIERLSTSLLDMPTGRWLLGIGGVVTIGVGLYFAIGKGVMRRFAKDLAGVSEDPSVNHGMDHALMISGVIGWIGRGVVTVLVGFFVTRSAVRFDPNEARGFDRALRQAATTSTGTALVWAAGVGLVLYGVFCLLSHRRRYLEDNS